MWTYMRQMEGDRESVGNGNVCALRWDRSEVKWHGVMMWGQMRGCNSRWDGTICQGGGER
jgi:hypothetical protein